MKTRLISAEEWLPIELDEKIVEQSLLSHIKDNDTQLKSIDRYDTQLERGH